MKKLISLCFALVLALALTATAGAAEAGGVQVQVNGEAVTFSGGSPEIVNGRTMVPMRAVLEALGAEVAYDAASSTVRASLGGETVLTHAVGTSAITTGDGGELTMDTPSYVKNGSTMVPLRFFSQALGYEVYWDGGANTAVVIDKKTAIEAIDKNFTVLNDAQAKRNGALDLSGNLAASVDFSGGITLPEHDTQLFSMKMSVLYGPEAMNMEGTMDLSALALLDGGEDAEMLAPMLKDLSFQMICGESIWMHSPVLTGLLRLSGVSLPTGEVWMRAGAMDMSAMRMMGADATIGGALYAMAEFMDKEVPVNIYDDLAEASELLTVLMGDSAFTKDGEDYSWKLDEARSAQLADALGASSVSFPFTMEMTVKADGGSAFSLELSANDSNPIAMSLSGTSTAASGSFQGRMQMEAVCDVTFQGEVKMQASGEAPVSAPPADAVVVDLDDYDSAPLTDVGVIGGPDGPTSIFTAF